MPYHLYGDSNVDRFLPLVKERKSDPQIQSTTFTKTTNAVLLKEALTHPAVAHAIIVIASLTNLITAKFFDDYDLLVEHCNTVFRDVLLWIDEGRTALPGFASQVYLLDLLCPASVLIEISLPVYNVPDSNCITNQSRKALTFVTMFLSSCPLSFQVLIFPPMLRRQPYWYSRWFGSIMLLFDTPSRQPDLPSIYVLPSFPNPEFELDGVHLTADIGPRYFFILSLHFLILYSRYL